MTNATPRNLPFVSFTVQPHLCCSIDLYQGGQKAISDLTLFRNNLCMASEICTNKHKVNHYTNHRIQPIFRRTFQLHGDLSFVYLKLFPSMVHCVVCFTKRNQYDTILKLYLIMFMVCSTWQRRKKRGQVKAGIVLLLQWTGDIGKRHVNQPLLFAICNMKLAFFAPNSFYCPFHE